EGSRWVMMTWRWIRRVADFLASCAVRAREMRSVNARRWRRKRVIAVESIEGRQLLSAGGMVSLSDTSLPQAMVAAGNVRAQQQALVTFFGEDLNTNEDFALTSHPNADMARDAFLTRLSNVSFEDFENIARGTLANDSNNPLIISFPTSAHPTDTATI